MSESMAYGGIRTVFSEYFQMQNNALKIKQMFGNIEVGCLYFLFFIKIMNSSQSHLYGSA